MIFYLKKLENIIIELSSKIYNITDEAYEEIVEYVNVNPEVVNSTGLLRKNKSCSYISFLLKEIYDYHTMTSVNNYPVYKMRNLYKEIQDSKELLNNIENEL